jgi:hypothetical protein
MNKIASILGAALLCSAFALQAQTPPKEPGKGMHGEHRKAMREKMKAAHEACKDKADRKACMTEQFCAKAQDPAQCQAKAKERQGKHAQRMEERQKMHEACNGKRGDELQKCLGEQHKQHRQHRKPEGKA